MPLAVECVHGQKIFVHMGFGQLDKMPVVGEKDNLGAARQLCQDIQGGG